MSNDTTQTGDSLGWIKNDAISGDKTDAEPVSGDIVLEGSLGIAEAESMHLKMTAILDAGVDISIASENLSRIDAAGAQLLYAFVKEAKSRSIALTWASVSESLQEVAAALGLSEGMGFGEANAS